MENTIGLSFAYLCLLSVILGRELQALLPIVGLYGDAIAAALKEKKGQRRL